MPGQLVAHGGLWLLLRSVGSWWPPFSAGIFLFTGLVSRPDLLSSSSRTEAQQEVASEVLEDRTQQDTISSRSGGSMVGEGQQTLTQLLGTFGCFVSLPPCSSSRPEDLVRFSAVMFSATPTSLTGWFLFSLWPFCCPGRPGLPRFSRGACTGALRWWGTARAFSLGGR